MWSKILLIPMAFVMNIGMNNLSLKFTTLALNQLIRSFSPVAIAITSFAIEGKRQSVPKAITLGVLVLGVLMGVAASPDFEMIGFLICGGSVIGQATGIVMTAFVMGGTKVKLHVFDVLLYATLPSLLVLLPWSYAMGEFEILEQAIEREGAGKILGLITAGGCLAASYNLLCTIFIRMTSSVYYGVTGGFRCALAIALSYQFFPQKATATSIAGICVAMSAFATNSVFTMREKLAAQNLAILQANRNNRSAEKQRLLDNDDQEEDVEQSSRIVISKQKL